MTNGDYFSNALFALKSIRKNLILFVPDLVYLILFGSLTLLFFHFNNLSSIFSGQLDTFTSSVKNIVYTRPLLFRLIYSFLVLIFFNVLLGITVISTRLTIIRKIIKGEKINILQVYKEAEKKLFSLFFLKVIILLIYIIPISILITIGLIYKPLLIIMIILSILTFIALKILFIFVYPILFLNGVKNPFKIIKLNSEYVEENPVHLIIVVLFIAIIGLLFGGFFILLPIAYGLLGYSTLILSLILFFIRTLADITVNLWNTLFVFKNY